MDSDVLIVGAGPTGLTLAIDLGKRGVRCILIEQKAQPAFLPKMERINARTMEIYRRMGLVQQIRAAGLRADCPMDVYIVLALNQPALLHLPYPSVAQAQAETRATNDGSLPLEPYQLISQYTLEPLLKAHRGNDSRRHGALRLRVSIAAAGRRRRHRARAHNGWPRREPARRLSGRLRWRHQPGAQGARHRAERRRQSVGPAPGALPLRQSCSSGCRSATAPARAGTITSPTTRRRS